MTREHSPIHKFHICLDKERPLWFTYELINSNRGHSYEKDIDDVQQHEDEAHPRVPRPHVDEGRPGRPQQEEGKREEEIDGISRGRAKGRQGVPPERGSTAWEPKPLAKMSEFANDKTI